MSFFTIDMFLIYSLHISFNQFANIMFNKFNDKVVKCFLLNFSKQKSSVCITNTSISVILILTKPDNREIWDIIN